MNRRKRICFVVSSAFSVKAFLFNQINALKENYDIYVVAYLENNKDTELIASLGINGYKNIKIVRKISLLHDILAVLNLTIYFWMMRFDAIHSLTPKAGLVCQLAGVMAFVKSRTHIFTGQVWCNMRGGKRKLLVFIDKLIVRLSTNILVDGKSQKEFLIQNKVVSDKKAVVLGEGSIAGIDLNKFVSSKEEKDKQKIKYNISVDKVVFSFLGRLNKDKGVPELLEAFSKLCLIRDNVFLILFGVDEEQIAMSFSRYEGLITSKNFLYAGHTTNPIESLQVSDVFCLPSHREGFGMSVIEAEALSIPIICSDTYGLRDTIVSGETGLRHKVGDVDSLLEAMLYMVDNPGKRKLMGEKGREYVEKNFCSTEITKYWVDYYKSLLR